MPLLIVIIMFFSFELSAKEKTPPPPVTPTPFIKPVPEKNSGVTDWDVLLGLDLKTGNEEDYI